MLDDFEQRREELPVNIQSPVQNHRLSSKIDSFAPPGLVQIDELVLAFCRGFRERRRRQRQQLGELAFKTWDKSYYNGPVCKSFARNTNLCRLRGLDILAQCIYILALERLPRRDKIQRSVFPNDLKRILRPATIMYNCWHIPSYYDITDIFRTNVKFEDISISIYIFQCPTCHSIAC